MSCVCFRLPKERHEVLNMGSYNYLGFSENRGPCAEAATETTRKYGVVSFNSRQELGKIWHNGEQLRVVCWI